MAWWLWVVIGFGLLVVETLTPGGFFFVFFGLAALVVGALAAVEAAGPDWMEWALFSVFSVAGILLFRRPLMRRFNLTHGKKVDSLVGETAVVIEDVAPGAVGKAEASLGPGRSDALGLVDGVGPPQATTTMIVAKPAASSRPGRDRRGIGA